MHTKKAKFSWLLAGSLALNACLGMTLALTGPWAHPHGPGGPPHRPPPPPSAIAERIAENLPPADAAVFHQSFSRHLPTLEQDYRAMSTIPERIRHILNAPELDQQALRQALEDMQAIRQRFGQAMNETTLDVAGKISPQSREKLWQPPPGPPPGPRP